LPISCFTIYYLKILKGKYSAVQQQNNRTQEY
jgi:hypothetical protein